MARPKLDRPNYKLVINRSGNYAVTWTEAGKTRSVSTGTDNEGLANIWLDRFVAGQDQPQPSLEPTIAEICHGYWREHGEKDNFKFSTKPVKEELGNLTPGMVSQMTIRRYAVKRRDKKNDTIRTELKYLHAACAWATREWKTSPLKFEMPVPPSPARDRWLTKDEVRAILTETKQPHTRLFIILAVMTAQRGIAICALKWEQVDFGRGLINFGEDVGKKRRATVPMNSQLREAMEAAHEIRTCDYVVEYASKQVKNPRKGVSRSSERAGLGKLGKHTLRHTAATWMVMEGRPEDEIARYLGTTVEMVRRVYGHHSPEYLRGAAEALKL